MGLHVGIGDLCLMQRGPGFYDQRVCIGSQLHFRFFQIVSPAKILSRIYPIPEEATIANSHGVVSDNVEGRPITFLIDVVLRAFLPGRQARFRKPVAPIQVRHRRWPQHAVPSNDILFVLCLPGPRCRIRERVGGSHGGADGGYQDGGLDEFVRGFVRRPIGPASSARRPPGT